MHRTLKIKVRLNKEQIDICNNTFGVCRFIWNKFIDLNIKTYNDAQLFIWGNDFSKFVNHSLSKEYTWIKDVSSKAVKETIRDADKALKRFCKDKVKGQGFLRFKSKKNPIESFYFIKDQVRLIDESHINLPILGKVKLCEIGYYDPKIHEVTGGRLKKEYGDYFICLKVKVIKQPKEILSKPIGIDMGIKHLAIIINGEDSVKIPNIYKSRKIKNKIERIKNLQRIQSTKVEENKKQKRKEGCYTSKDIRVLQSKINKQYRTITRIREDFIKKLCHSLVKNKPGYITIEDLDVTSMLEKGSSSLANNLQGSSLRYFRTFLESKCGLLNIELRIADNRFPSSKKCSCCGNVKKKLKLSERIYKCEKCGYIEDRDINASKNLLVCEDFNLSA